MLCDQCCETIDVTGTILTSCPHCKTSIYRSYIKPEHISKTKLGTFTWVDYDFPCPLCWASIHYGEEEELVTPSTPKQSNLELFRGSLAFLPHDDLWNQDERPRD